MDLHYLQCWRVALLLLLMPCGYRCMSVHILDEDPVHVIPGTSLVLKAQINHGPLEEISMVTWEREPETGSPPRKVTLATCPGKNIKCADTLPNAHVSAEQQGTTLKLEGYSPADSGVYAITVTDQNGVKTTAQCIVREYEPVHHVSVSVNVSHSTLVCGEAWGTDPQFSWLYERNAISKSVGSVSKDGKTLYLVSSAPICGHFTCMVTNKLGHSVATYTAAPCESEGKGRATTAAVVCLVILVACGAVLAFLLWRRKRRYNNRGERLHEHLDDSI